MNELQSNAMTDAEVDEFLGDGGTGVLALGHENDAYAVPISYGYDADDPAIYLRLAFAPESEKQPFVESGGLASLVVHGDGTAGWRSVVARGTLHEVTETALDSRVAEAIRRVDIPFVTIYDRPARELEFRIYRLSIETLTGRVEQ